MMPTSEFGRRRRGKLWSEIAHVLPRPQQHGVVGDVRQRKGGTSRVSVGLGQADSLVEGW